MKRSRRTPKKRRGLVTWRDTCTAWRHRDMRCDSKLRATRYLTLVVCLDIVIIKNCSSSSTTDVILTGLLLTPWRSQYGGQWRNCST